MYCLPFCTGPTVHFDETENTLRKGEFIYLWNSDGIKSSYWKIHRRSFFIHSLIHNYSVRAMQISITRELIRDGYPMPIVLKLSRAMWRGKLHHYSLCRLVGASRVDYSIVSGFWRIRNVSVGLTDPSVLTFPGENGANAGDLTETKLNVEHLFLTWTSTSSFVASFPNICYKKF